MSILKTYLVPSVREIFEQLGDSGSLSPDKKKSLVEKAPEDHLAEQRKVSTVFEALHRSYPIGCSNANALHRSDPIGSSHFARIVQIILA